MKVQHVLFSYLFGNAVKMRCLACVVLVYKESLSPMQTHTPRNLPRVTSTFLLVVGCSRYILSPKSYNPNS